jgi:peptidoglycan/xylan/chitin deacetylase (PgdA/CDA1 family)
MEQDVTLSIHLVEDEDDSTQAIAMLDLRGEHFEATGTSHRNPTDDPRPVIGEEIAIARALSELQNQLVEAAWGKIYPTKSR